MNRQLSIGDLCTSDIVQLAFVRKEKRRAKEPAEDSFAADLVAFQLPPFVRQFPLIKTDQSERKRNEPLKWSFDFCFPTYKLIVEIDGGIWTRGAHGHPVDIVRNMAKRNDAVEAGYSVLCFQTKDVTAKARPALAFTVRVLMARGWQRPAQSIVEKSSAL